MAHADLPEEPLYDHELFLKAVATAEENIAAAALYTYGSVQAVVGRERPIIQKHALRVHGNPSEDTSPIRYYEALRTSEETLRRTIVRGLGYVMTAPLLAKTMDIIDNGIVHSEDTEQTFAPDIARGRVHQGKRGKLVSDADGILRIVTDTTLDTLGAAWLEGNIKPTFVDITSRVRFYCEQLLDLKFGDTWRQLDTTEVISMQVKELNGKKLSKHDRRLLLGPHKLLDIYPAVGNAVVAAAEFTAIAVEHMQQALAEDGVTSEEWYPYAFANLSKIGFAAQLPFWPAQDIGLQANSSEMPTMFKATKVADGSREITFADLSLQNYYEKGLVANCQGALRPPARYLRQNDLRTMSGFVIRLDDLTRVGDMQLAHDWTDASTFKPVTSAEASTALALGVAYSGNYYFAEESK